jgi:hypothetical protein
MRVARVDPAKMNRSSVLIIPFALYEIMLGPKRQTRQLRTENRPL